MIQILINKTYKFIIFIAIISFISTWAFNIYNVLVTKTNINGITIYTVNLRIYLENLSNAWQTEVLDFKDILPTREWTPTNDNFLTYQYWNALGNNLALLFDYLYLPINFILYLWRWAAWLIKLVLAIIGWNVYVDQYGNYYSNFVEVLNWITQNLMIPYV